MMRKYRPHNCEKKMKPIKEGKTTKSRDDLVYTFNEGNFLLLKVESKTNDVLNCSEINCEAKTFSRHEDLNFGLVGVFKDFGKRNRFHQIHENSIQGKLIRSRGLVMTASKNVLLEI